MGVRTATLQDLGFIRSLPVQLGAISTQGLKGGGLAELLGSPDHRALVYTAGLRRAGFLVMQFLPGTGIRGGFAVITHFAVDRPGRNWDTAVLLEEQAVELARVQFAACLLSQCQLKSPEARRFFLCQGYAPLEAHYVKHFSYTQQTYHEQIQQP